MGRTTWKRSSLWIRKLHKEDVPRITRLINAYAAGPVLDGNQFTRKEDRTLVDVAVVCGAIAGVLVYAYDPWRRIIDLKTVVVHEAYWRLGVGSALIANLTRKLDRTYTSIVATVWTRNVSGHRFLEANGFRLCPSNAASPHGLWKTRARAVVVTFTRHLDARVSY